MTTFVRTGFVALLFVACCQSTQAADSDRLAFGALRFGMSLDEARAAYPGVAWTVTDQHHTTKRVYAIKADDVVPLAGVTFDVEIGSRYSGATIWKLKAQDTVANAAACHERIVGVVVELEQRFGKFHHLGDVITGEAVIRVGMESDAKITTAERMRAVDPRTALQKDPQQYWFGARHDPGDSPDDLSIHARAEYRRDESRSCEISVQLEGGEERPPTELQRAIDEARWIGGPTIAYRNRSLRAIGVPDKPLKFMMPCRISAAGRVGACASGASGEDVDPYRSLAADWATRFELKVESAETDDLRYFDVDVPITIGPEDARTVDVSTGRVLESEQLVVVRNPQINPDELYTREMRQLKSGAEVTVLCKVQEDGSVLCDIKPGTSSPSQDFTNAAIEIGERLQVRTELRDGTSAVGGVFERRIKFVPLPD